MAEVKCPNCGSPMKLRTARKGKNAGGKFYGCSRFPECTETLPYDNRDNEQVRSYANDNSSEADTFPRVLYAREKFKNYQVRFFETVAVPEKILKKYNSEDIPIEILQSFSQWRLDFPSSLNGELTEKQCQIVSVMEKILTRGRLTLTSHELEKAFNELFNCPSVEDYTLSLLAPLFLRGYRAKGKRRYWLDSKEESIFYENILPEILGGNYSQFVIPQVSFSSLVSEDLGSTGYQRVDFAIFHPRLEEKIIVEIDGEQHKEHRELDKEKDDCLSKSGFTVIRIPAKEAIDNNSSKISFLKSKLAFIEDENDDIPERIIKWIYAFKIAHQLQISILQAIQLGFLSLEKEVWHIYSDLDQGDIFNRKEAFEILIKSAEDIFELLKKVSNIYSSDLNVRKIVCNLFADAEQGTKDNAINISFNDNEISGLPTFYVQNIYFPYHIANTSISVSPLIGGLERPAKKDLLYFLEYLFRKPDFWEGQYEGIARVIQGKDALVLLPTGAGKSMIYQLASFLLPGRTVVIDPIISLMEDQIDNLSTMGIDRCIAITSQLENPDEREKVLNLFGQGEYLFAFVAPERFQTEAFRNSIKALTVHTPIAMVVVDEAHCVSEWGHDFRTAYLNIGRVSRAYCKSGNWVPPVIGLTGTASRAVLKDVQRELQIEEFDAIITPKSFDRKELKFWIVKCSSKEKIAKLRGLLGQKLPTIFKSTSTSFYQVRDDDTCAGLIFCPHVDGDFGVNRVCGDIKKELRIPADIYSGKEPKLWSQENYRLHKRYVTKEFKRNRLPLLVCTKAFGMGIDKPNIRYTVHFSLPSSIESFYQEAGRAGRDRNTAHCFIIVSDDNSERSKKLLDPNTTVEELEKIVNDTNDEKDDITRALYFHVNSFRGTSKEKQEIMEVLNNLGDISKPANKKLILADKERNIIEKALHRLLLIGVVNDYTINYANNEFNVKLSGATKEQIIECYGKYVASYLHSRRQNEVDKAEKLINLPLVDFIGGMIDLLLNFIYDVIERGRRRALQEMLLACKNSADGSEFRKRILRYLEATEYSEALERLLNEENAGLIKCKDIFSSIRSPNESAELRGQVSRYLESYPDHPALLMLRALSEIYSSDKNNDVAKQNFVNSISTATTKYGINVDKIIEFIAWAISNVANRDLELARVFIYEALNFYHNRALARKLVEALPTSLGYIPAWFLLSEIEKKCKYFISMDRR